MVELKTIFSFFFLFQMLEKYKHLFGIHNDIDDVNLLKLLRVGK